MQIEVVLIQYYNFSRRLLRKIFPFISIFLLFVLNLRLIVHYTTSLEPFKTHLRLHYNLKDFQNKI